MTTGRTPFLENVRRHKLVTGLIATVMTLWFISAVSGSTDDRSTAGDVPGASGSSGDREPATGDDADRGDTSGRASPSPASKPKRRTYLVVHVADGDTITLANGEKVRLAGIDAPEVGQCGYKRARNKLARLVLDKRITLGASDEDRDRYGRLLRYVDVNGVDSGLRLIKNGLAVAKYDSRDGYGFHPREPKYIEADRVSPAFTCAKPVPFMAKPQEKKKQNCAPGYSPCIPPYPPDLDCPDIGHPVQVTGSDPHGLDRDRDGVACEWS